MQKYSRSQIVEFIEKNKSWIVNNPERRNTVYCQMLENSIQQLEQGLEFMDKFGDEFIEI